MCAGRKPGGSNLLACVETILGTQKDKQINKVMNSPRKSLREFACLVNSKKFLEGKGCSKLEVNGLTRLRVNAFTREKLGLRAYFSFKCFPGFALLSQMQSIHALPEWIWFKVLPYAYVFS